MRRCFSIITGVLLLCLALVTVVSAATSGPPGDDAYVNVNQPDEPHDGQSLAVSGSRPADASGCTDTEVVYLKWDLSDLSPTADVGTVTLTLRTNFAFGTQEARLSLYEAADLYGSTTIPWDESGLTYNNAPTVNWAVPLLTVAAPTSVGEVVSFEGDTLRDYLLSQASGDDEASFALRLSGGCATLTTISFDARESSIGTVPYLLLSTPTAVRVTGFGVVAPESMGKIGAVVMVCVLVGAMIWALPRFRGER